MNTKRRTLHHLLSVIIVMATVLTGQLNHATAQPPLDEADQALRHGDYDTAIAQYTAALDDEEAACDALYGLGTTYIRAGQYADADATWTRYIDTCGTQFRALVMRAQARQQAGDVQQALEDYQQAIALQPGILDSYLYERMAALDPDQGIHFLRLAAEADRTLQSKVDLRETLAEIYSLIGNPTQAIAQYDLILSDIEAYLATLSSIEGAEFDTSGSLRARILYEAAQTEIENGQLDAGYARLQRIITDYPETDSALPALIDLILAGQPVDLLTRMQINVANENYFPVVDVLADYLDDPATRAEEPAELVVLLGQAQQGMGDYEAATGTLSTAATEFPDDPAASTALLELGQTYELLGNPEQALQTYTQLIERYPQAPEIPQGLLSSADIHRTAGNIASALPLYQRLAQNYPDAEATQRGIFDAALELMQTDPAAAAELFGLSGTAKALVWKGKLLQQVGNVDGAQDAWRQATSVEQGTLFAMRACTLLNDVDFFAPSGTLAIEPLTEDDRRAAEQWVADVFGLENVSSDLSPELAENSILRRATELWAVGMRSEARAEFGTLHTLNRNNPAALLQLAFHYPSLHAYRPSLYAATRLLFASEQPRSQVPTAILRLAYPYYFADVIVPIAEEYGLDPLLVGSLIRQESSFDPTAQSFAGARGLMQLMPATAQDVARRLGMEQFSLPDLDRPIINVEMGAFYLDSMLSFQDGSVLGALLSYNAGPGNAASWLATAGDDLEQLYETVPFEESRLYIELISENYAAYSYLYGGPVPDCMFEGPQAAAE